jgi:CRISPR-associated endonuclease Csy4
MKFYIDITLLPDAEVGLHFLWQKLYQQTHLALVQMKNANGAASIAVAFPDYNTEEHQLGKKLRLFTTEQSQLESLDIQKWLARLSDYVHITQIREVPANIRGYACFSRLQAKSSIGRIARRKARRQGITDDKALEMLTKFKERKLNEPFINLQSLSGGKSFRLFIAKKTVDQPVKGCFNLYGLSSTATIPWF